MSTHFYVAGGQSLETTKRFISEMQAARTERNNFCKKYKAKGISWNNCEWSLVFDTDAAGVTRYPDGFRSHKKLDGCVGDPKHPLGREIRKEMKLPKYDEPHDLARRLGLRDINFEDGRFVSHSVGFHVFDDGVIVLRCAPWQVPADSTRISDLDYEKMVADEQAREQAAKPKSRAKRQAAQSP